ncbi:IS3 family transposase [Oxalobacter vibrioformis]
MCRCLNISPGGYYAWKSRVSSARQQDNQRLGKHIKALHQQSDGVMGSPRIWKALRHQR